MTGKNLILVLLTLAILVAVPDRAVIAASHEAQVTLLRDHEFADALIAGVRNARRDIICSYYLFVVKGKSDSTRILDEFIRARRRGVDIKVILEKNRFKDQLNEENLHTAALLSGAGIKVYFDNPSVVTHTKVTIIDGRYVFLGSHNLTMGALQQNNELSLLVDSSELAAEVRSYLNNL